MTQVIVVALALLAALCAAVGIVVRQLATRHVPAEHGMTPAIMIALVRNPLWWAGTGSAVVGYLFQALALTHGSLLLVQPLLASALMFALPISAHIAGDRVTRAEWAWAGLLTIGLAVFVLVGRPREGSFQPSLAAALTVGAICISLLAFCVVGAARSMGTRRAVLLAIAVGTMFGIGRVIDQDLHPPTCRGRVAGHAGYTGSLPVGHRCRHGHVAPAVGVPCRRSADIGADNAGPGAGGGSCAGHPGIG
jgi:drug/metabolite transporter (DMT)-like permease